MKNVVFVSSLFFILSIFSCTESDEPRAPLLGSWENRTFVDSLNIWFVETYTFKNDSLFDIKSTVREIETGPDLGYRLTSTAWYSLDGDLFQYYYSNALMYFPGESNSPLYVPEDELRAGVVDLFRRPEGILTFSNDRRQFTFQEECFIANSEAPCVQFPSRTYIKVD